MGHGKEGLKVNDEYEYQGVSVLPRATELVSLIYMLKYPARDVCEVLLVHSAPLASRASLVLSSHVTISQSRVFQNLNQRIMH
jgi:hypothetical protein